MPPNAAGHVRVGDEGCSAHALVAGVVEAVARFMPHDPAQATVQAGDAVPARERGKRNQAAVAVHGGCEGGGGVDFMSKKGGDSIAAVINSVFSVGS